MSDEEKKAIEILENMELDINNIYSVDLRTYNFAVKSVLNLIEKQSKEIEELKKPRYLYNAHTGEITKLENSNCISKDKIIKLKAKIEDKLHIVTPGCSEIEIINEFKNEGAVNILNELLEE